MGNSMGWVMGWVWDGVWAVQKQLGQLISPSHPILIGMGWVMGWALQKQLGQPIYPSHDNAYSHPTGVNRGGEHKKMYGYIISKTIVKIKIRRLFHGFQVRF